MFLDYESSYFGTVSKVRHDKIHALVLHRRVCWVISEDSQKSWHWSVLSQLFTQESDPNLPFSFAVEPTNQLIY